jgi:hypothetical protein
MKMGADIADVRENETTLRGSHHCIATSFPGYQWLTEVESFERHHKLLATRTEWPDGEGFVKGRTIGRINIAEPLAS